MIYQEILLGTIIGSMISTAGAILVWVILEYLKSMRVKRKENRNFNELYRLFEKRKSEPTFSIEVTNLIEEIGIKKIQKVLSMNYKACSGFPDYIFENLLFDLEVYFREGDNFIVIKDRMGSYGYAEEDNDNYDVDDNDIEVVKRFLKYFRKQCEKENIKIK